MVRVILKFNSYSIHTSIVLHIKPLDYRTSSREKILPTAVLFKEKYIQPVRGMLHRGGHRQPSVCPVCVVSLPLVVYIFPLVMNQLAWHFA